MIFAEGNLNSRFSRTSIAEGAAAVAEDAGSGLCAATGRTSSQAISNPNGKPIAFRNMALISLFKKSFI